MSLERYVRLIRFRCIAVYFKVPEPPPRFLHRGSRCHSNFSRPETSAGFRVQPLEVVVSGATSGHSTDGIGPPESVTVREGRDLVGLYKNPFEICMTHQPPGC